MWRLIGLQSPAEGDEDEGGRVDPERAGRAVAREVLYAVVIMCKHFVEYFSNAYAYKVALKHMKLHS